MFLPLLLLIAVLIRIDSCGPCLLRQTRWGMDGRTIRVWKFRTMHADRTDATGVAQTRRQDDRITRLGVFLRRFSLDELPQFLNVLVGDMSLVGPRCHPVGMLAAGRLYEELVPDYHARHAVRPGMTGLAQIHGLRGPTDCPEKARSRIRHDIRYIETMSPWLDLRIIAATVLLELRGGGGS